MVQKLFNWSDDDDYRDFDADDEYYEERHRRRRHNLLMRLEPGHPDEEMYEDEDESFKETDC